LQLIARDPSHFLTEHRSRKAAQAASTKVQTNRFFRIDVLGRQDFGSDVDLDVELLAEFPRQARFVRFARLALAAGELPQVGEMRALQATRYEKSSVPFDDAGEDDDHEFPGSKGPGLRLLGPGLRFLGPGLRFSKGNDLHCLRIVQEPHCGARAAQIVAPKSINA